MKSERSLLQRENEVWEVEFSVGSTRLEGELILPPGAASLILFAHGSGSSRFSPRNRFVAQMLHRENHGTLLFDLLSPAEEAEDLQFGHLRFDIIMLASRLVEVSQELLIAEQTRHLQMGYFGSSTGGGAALVASAELGTKIHAVVSRGGRPDMAGSALHHVQSPTLLIVGGLDRPVIRLNEEAFIQLRCEKEMRIVPGATHLFEEPGKLEEVGRMAAAWFTKHLTGG